MVKPSVNPVNRRSRPDNDQADRSEQPELDRNGFHEPPRDDGLSLDQLSEAFTAMLGSGSDPYGPGSDSQAAAISGAPARVADDPRSAGEAEPTGEVSPRSILEAMLFVGHADNSPIEGRRVADLMRGVTPAEIDTLVQDLNEQYAAQNRPYRIKSEGSGYRMELNAAMEPLREKFYGRVRRARLSQAAIAVLSIVAYQGPITREQVDRLRDCPSSGILSQLVRRNLLAVERHPDDRRKVRYRTTGRFLSLFGLESLDDLPRVQQADDGQSPDGQSPAAS